MIRSRTTGLNGQRSCESTHHHYLERLEQIESCRIVEGKEPEISHEVVTDPNSDGFKNKKPAVFHFQQAQHGFKKTPHPLRDAVVEAAHKVKADKKNEQCRSQ